MSDAVKLTIHRLHSVVHADECPKGASFAEYVYLSEYQALATAYDALEAENVRLRDAMFMLEDLRQIILRLLPAPPSQHPTTRGTSDGRHSRCDAGR